MGADPLNAPMRLRNKDGWSRLEQPSRDMAAFINSERPELAQDQLSRQLGAHREPSRSRGNNGPEFKKSTTGNGRGDRRAKVRRGRYSTVAEASTRDIAREMVTQAMHSAGAVKTIGARGSSPTRRRAWLVPCVGEHTREVLRNRMRRGGDRADVAGAHYARPKGGRGGVGQDPISPRRP